MEHPVGVGGYFLRAADPEALTAWYRDVLGLPLDEHGMWEAPPGPVVFAAFPADTTYLPERQQTMLNLRVGDLDAVLARLRAAGAAVDERVEDMAGVGRFGWVTDPEGHRVELWQPA